MTEAGRRLIVALDVPSVDEARALVDKLGDSVGVYKIGLELLFSGGFALAEELAGHGHAVFVDAKLLDIEATIERATAAVARMGVTISPNKASIIRCRKWCCIAQSSPRKRASTA
jgi:orotidine-5'-phosphate decarboxylase